MKKLLFFTACFLFSSFLHAQDAQKSKTKTNLVKVDTEADAAKSDADTDMEKFKEGMETLEYLGEMGIATEKCQQKYPGLKSNDKNLGSCLIKSLYPLAEQGNYLAAMIIAETYGALGYPEEQIKWAEYTASMDNIPDDIRQELDANLTKLKNEAKE